MFGIMDRGTLEKVVVGGDIDTVLVCLSDMRCTLVGRCVTRKFYLV